MASIMTFQMRGIHTDTNRLAFVVHLVAYSVASVAFVLIDMLVKRYSDRPGLLNWVYWPVLGWGIGVLVHGWVTFSLLAGDDAESEGPPPGILIPLP